MTAKTHLQPKAPSDPSAFNVPKVICGSLLIGLTLELKTLATLRCRCEDRPAALKQEVKGWVLAVQLKSARLAVIRGSLADVNFSLIPLVKES